MSKITYTLNRAGYDHSINKLSGRGLSEANANAARAPDVRNEFMAVVDSVNCNDIAALRVSIPFLLDILGKAAVDNILREIHPGLLTDVARRLGQGLVTASNLPTS